MENQYVVQKTSLMEVNTRRMPLTISKLLSWGQMAVSLIFAANAYFRLCDSFVQPISLVAVGSAFLNLQVVYVSISGSFLITDPKTPQITMPFISSLGSGSCSFHFSTAQVSADTFRSCFLPFFYLCYIYCR